MKKLYLLLSLLLICSFSFAQNNFEGFSYQAVVRTPDGLPLVNKEIEIHIDLFSKNQLDPMYSENHQSRTDNFGQLSIIIGQGSQIQGSLEAIPWNEGSIYYKVTLSNKKEDLEIISEAQLLAVPYAYYAMKAGELNSTDPDNLHFAGNPPPSDDSSGSPGSVWSITGNQNADNHSDPPLLGTKDLNPISIITNDIERIHISETGEISIQNSTIEDDLTAKGNVLLNTEGGSTTINGETTIGGNAMNTTTLTGDVQINKQLNVGGNTSLNDNLNVAGNTDLGNDLNISGNTTINQTLGVNGNTTLNDNLNVTGNTDLGNDLNISGNTTINQTLDVSGNTTLNDNLTVDGNATIQGETTLNGAMDINHDLTVSGATQLDSSLSVSKETNLNDNLNVAGITDLGNNLNVSGNTSINQTLDVNGNTTLNDNLNVVGDATIEGETTLNGAMDINHDLTVSGATQLDSSLSVSKETNLNDNLNVTGNTDLGNDLNVSGNTSINLTLDVNGNTTLNDNLNVIGDATIEGETTLNGALDINHDLTVSGATQLDSSLSVSKETNLNDNLNVAGITDLGNNLNVSGNTTINQTLDVSGNTTLSDNLEIGGNVSINGSAVFNEQGLDKDFRIESKSEEHALFVNGNNGKIGINNANPTGDFDVKGSFHVRSGNTVFNSGGGDFNTRIESEEDQFLFLAKPSGQGRIGIGTSNPQAKLHVRGSFLTRGGDVTINNESENFDIRFKSMNNPTMFFMDASSNRIGIKTNEPSAAFDVEGSTEFNGTSTVNGSSIMNGTVSINGDLTTKTGNAVFNETGQEHNFRVESVNKNKMIIVDAANDRLGIGMDGSTNLATTLDVKGTVQTKGGNVTINEGSGNYDTRIESNAKEHMFFVDASENKIGINTDSPQSTLDVNGHTTTDDLDVTGKSILNNVDINGKTKMLGPVVLDSSLTVKNEFKTQSGVAVFNETGEEHNFRVESVNNTKMIIVDAANDRLGIGMDGSATPSTTLDVKGTVQTKGGEVTINEGGGDFDTRIESNSREHMFFVDASENKIGINTDTPQSTLDVVGKSTLDKLVVNDQTNFNGPVILDSVLTVKNEFKTQDGNVVFNDTKESYDFKVKSLNKNKMLFVEGATDRIGIGMSNTATPSATLDVKGTVKVSDSLLISGFTQFEDKLDLTTTDPSFIAVFQNTYASNGGDGLKIKLGRPRENNFIPTIPDLLSTNKANKIKKLIDSETPDNERIDVLAEIIEEGLDEDLEIIGGLAVKTGNLIKDFINDEVGLPYNISDPVNDGLGLPYDLKSKINDKLGLPLGFHIYKVIDDTPVLGYLVGQNDLPGPKTTIVPALSETFKIPALPDVEIPKIPNINLEDFDIEELPLEDPEFWGIPLDLSFTEVVPNPLNNNNEFIQFTDVNDERLGSIRAVSISDWTENYLNPVFLFTLYSALTSAVDKKHAKYHFTTEITKALKDYATIGVEYSSGNGDYAEWLEREDPKEVISEGDIVGVIGGKISKNLEGAEQVMAVSHFPIVLGNIPIDGKTEDGNNVAFMGQIPVKIMGPVSSGDYIVAVETTPGYGIAKSPSEMTVEDFKLTVGRSWENSPTEGPKMINTVVGVHNGDYLKILQKYESKFQETEERFKNLESKIDQLSAALMNNIEND